MDVVRLQMIDSFDKANNMGPGAVLSKHSTTIVPKLITCTICRTTFQEYMATGQTGGNI